MKRVFRSSITRLYVRFILSFKKEWSMSAYAIDLRCNLHGQVLVGRYLFASGKTQVERCRLQDVSKPKV